MPSTAIALPPPLSEGDRLDSAEFLRRWEAMPELKHAELIDGVVFMPSPVSITHGTVHNDVSGWVFFYRTKTPGCQAGNDTTWIMGPKDVPQPDTYLRILPEFGGQSSESGSCGFGAPELVVEVSGSSRSRDLGVKLDLYRRTGVREYLTVSLRPRKTIWRELVRGRYREIAPGDDGLIRSHAFPGLWLDPAAIWNGNILAAAERGLRSPEHAAFVQQLAAAGRLRNS